MDITIHHSFGFGSALTIHLDELERSVGKREKDQYNGRYYTAISLTQCRKLLRLILLHAEREEIQRVDYWMTDCKNEMVRKIWDAEVDRLGGIT